MTLSYIVIATVINLNLQTWLLCLTVAQYVLIQMPFYLRYLHYVV